MIRCQRERRAIATSLKRIGLLLGAAVMLLITLAATPASALADRDAQQKEQKEASMSSISTKCVAGTAPAGNTPPGTCSSPFDPPPNLDKKCGFALVKIAAQIWVPGAFVKAWKVLRYAQKLIGGVTIPVAVWGWGTEWVEGHFKNGVDWVERWVCRDA